MSSNTIQAKAAVTNVISWIFGISVLVIGILNIVLVHPVPGIIYLLLSLVFLPPVNTFFKNKMGVSIPRVVQIILAVIIIQFTLGVSDLGDMIDDWLI
ncbi:hypothetical protein GCM10011378_32590 [Hymenobacter glacieicola]|uniref:AI-2E family transporter n=2 Tax=Hymenobacter glacieicola TaxID=1562124 RepID=A0ABQ1X0I0_9BACT|nr:hypothetical protein GCM10011378_32590 [Hymenobacter glacieicola]